MVNSGGEYFLENVLLNTSNKKNIILFQTDYLAITNNIYFLRGGEQLRIIQGFSFIVMLLVFASVSSAEEFETVNFNQGHKLLQDSTIQNEWMIQFKTNIASEERASIFQTVKATEISYIEQGFISLVKTSNQTSPADIETLLKNYTQIESVEPNQKSIKQYVPRDPGYTEQWYLKKIQAPVAWEQTKGSSKVTVAVIDDGVQTNHPDLAGKFVHPYNAVTGYSSIPAGDHGTHVAGVIGATMNKIGVAGISPNVKIIPINVFKGEYADLYSIVRGIYYAADHKAQVINLSLGSYDYSKSEYDAITYAKRKGAVVIAAAGNEHNSKKNYPAAYNHVIAVSATDSKDQITKFSSYGSHIDLSAPGKNILSTISKSKYAFADGTSMATPVVSGVAALVRSKNPFISPNQVEAILKKSVIDLGAKGKDQYYGYGRIDVKKALANTSKPLSSITVASTLNVDEKTNHNIAVFAQKGKLTLNIKDSKGKIVKALRTNTQWNGGKFSIKWNGKLDNGTFAPSGTYKIIASLSNGSAQVSTSKNIKIVNQASASDKVVITAPSVADYYSGENGSIVFYKLSNDATVTVEIYNDKQQKVKTIQSNGVTSKGINSFQWDGKDERGYHVYGSNFPYKIKAVSPSGQVSAVKGVISKTDNPKWLKENKYRFVSTNKRQVELFITTTEPIKLTISLYDLKTKKLYETKNLGTKKWTGRTVYTKPTTNKCILTFELQDGLGNKYFYKIPGSFSLQVPSVEKAKSLLDL